MFIKKSSSYLKVPCIFEQTIGKDPSRFIIASHRPFISLVMHRKAFLSQLRQWQLPT